MKKSNVATLAVVGLLASTLVLSCKKDIPQTGLSSSQTNPRAFSIFGNNAVDFQSPALGTYDEPKYITDFGNNSSGAWDGTRAGIANIDYSKVLYIKLLKNQLSSACGVLGRTDISDGTEYSVSFDIKFKYNFNWDVGGKVGLGLGTGLVRTGENESTMAKNDGGSARLMWYHYTQYNPSTGKTDSICKFKPYVYFLDGSASNIVQYAHYPDPNSASFSSIQKGVWYRVSIKVKSNTITNGVANHDGLVWYGIKLRTETSFVTILNATNVRFSDKDWNRKITNLLFDTFRGGSYNDPNGLDWTANTDDYIYYDNINITKIN